MSPVSTFLKTEWKNKMALQWIIHGLQKLLNITCPIGQPHHWAPLYHVLVHWQGPRETEHVREYLRVGA
jgi:hypothetical protein